MKIYTLASILFFIILGIIANIFLFKFSIMQLIGFMLLAIVILGIFINFFIKANRKRKGVEGEPDAFIFPDKTAKKMKKIDLGIQYEASVISSSLLLVGMTLFLIYFTFFTDNPWILKGFVIFNSLCGMGLMGGMLVTYYQQLVAYRESTKFLRQAAYKEQDKEKYAEDEEYDEYDEEYLFNDAERRI